MQITLLSCQGHKVLRIDGTITKTDERQHLINTFQTDPSYSCFLLTTQVCRQVLTFQNFFRTRVVPARFFNITSPFPRLRHLKNSYFREWHLDLTRWKGSTHDTSNNCARHRSLSSPAGTSQLLAHWVLHIGDDSSIKQIDLTNCNKSKKKSMMKT